MFDSGIVQIGAGLVAIGIVWFIAMYLGRAFVLWYLRISEAVELLRSIDFSLQQLPAVRQAKIDRFRR